jgi:trehalose 6-phosphate phosphatase
VDPHKRPAQSPVGILLKTRATGRPAQHRTLEGRRARPPDPLNPERASPGPRTGPERRTRTGAARGPRHLFEDWPRVSARLNAAKHLALFLDFDGTLAPLRPRPEDVWLDRRTRRVLGVLARHRRITLWIISGRRRADARKRVGVPGIHYAGLHGWERAGKSSLPHPVRRALVGAKRQLAAQIDALPDAWIEDKGLSFTFHYRDAPDGTVRRVQRAIRKLSERFGPQLRVLQGKKIWEVLPAEVQGKGAAVRAILAQRPQPALPVYVGDDASGESAFRALPDGLTVRVGRGRPTQALFWLRNPDEVREFLKRVRGELLKPGP